MMQEQNGVTQNLVPADIGGDIPLIVVLTRALKSTENNKFSFAAASCSFYKDVYISILACHSVELPPRFFVRMR